MTEAELDFFAERELHGRDPKAAKIAHHLWWMCSLSPHIARGKLSGRVLNENRGLLKSLGCDV